MIELLIQGFMQVFSSFSWVYMIGGILGGLILGFIPGLSATTAIPFILPMTFYLDPITSLLMLLAAYKASLFAGSISAILLGTPGTPAAAMTLADGYTLAKEGKGRKALKMSLVASVTGDLFSDIVLILVAVPLARFALKFGPPEYTMVVVFSLTMIGVASSRSLFKGLITAVTGLLISTIGLDPIVGIPRLSFDNPNLYSGINLMAILIGLLAMSEIFIQVERKLVQKTVHLPTPKNKEDTRLSLKELRRCLKTIFRSAVIGTFIGSLPGLGPSLAAMLGYNIAKERSKDPDRFGKGDLEGIAAAEAANNAVSGANMIPLLALGVPGDVTAAVLIGAFLIQGIQPGPMIFREHPDVIYGVYAGLIIANILLFLIAYPLLKYFVKIAHLQVAHIFPLIMVFSIVGAYAVNQNWFDAGVMLFFGMVGYIMKKFKFPVIPLLIGFILGPMFETSFCQSLIISRGNLLVFFHGPISIVFGILAILSIIWGSRGSTRTIDI